MTTGEVTLTAEQLWDALDRADTDHHSRTVGHHADVLFRYYLPMACSIAAQYAADHADPDTVREAAEVGLAQAILGWRLRRPAGFDRYALDMITRQLRHRGSIGGRTRRPRPAVRPPPADPAGP